MNIKEALEYGIELLKEKNINEPIMKARIILSHVLGKNKEYLLIHEKEELTEEDNKKFKGCLSKLSNHIPLQYITNKQEFMGIEFYVDENVLIPQPDTEILVEEVINICRKENKSKILDLCTGSGAIGISISKNINNSCVYLSDISIDALKVAKRNCDSILGKNKIEVIKSDLFDNIEGKFDIIVSNPPYIKSKVIKTLDKEVQNEPLLALDGGEDGLDIYRRIIDEAYKYLNEDGYLSLEIGYDQKDQVIELINKSRMYENVYCKKDLAGNNRAIISKKLSKRYWTAWKNMVL